MKSENYLSIEGGRNRKIFNLSEGSIWYRENITDAYPALGSYHDKIVINLESEGEPVEGGDEYESDVSIDLSWFVKKADFDTLVGKTIEIPSSYSQEHEDHFTCFYYFEHLDFDNCKIKILEKIDGLFSVEVTGEIEDPDGESEEPLKVTIISKVKVTKR